MPFNLSKNASNSPPATPNNGMSMTEQYPDIGFIGQLANAIGDALSHPEQLIGNIAAMLFVLMVLGVLGWTLNIIRKVVVELFWLFINRFQTLPLLRPWVIKSYRKQVHAKYSKVTNIYLDKPEEELDLQQVFVPLTLVDPNPQQLKSRETRAILTDANNQHMVILGGAGFGKTTLLKALASGISIGQWHELKHSVPVFISLRAYAQQQPMLSFYDWVIQQVLPEFQLKHANSLFKQLLQQGKVLLLLDGLDEITSSRLDPVLDNLRDFIKQQYGDNNRIILTCREQNYQLLSDNNALRRLGFVEYRMTPMRDSQVEQMVSNRAADFAQFEHKTIANFLTHYRTLFHNLLPNIENIM